MKHIHRPKFNHDQLESRLRATLGQARQVEEQIADQEKFDERMAAANSAIDSALAKKYGIRR